MSCRRCANEEVTLNTKANPKVKGGSNATKRIITAGEIFANGTMIELVPVLLGLINLISCGGTGKRRLLERASNTAVGLTRYLNWTRVYTGQRGFPLDVTITIQPVTCLPRSSICLCIVSICPERESSLLACFSIGTWLADRLPSAPSLAISGPESGVGN